MIDKVGTGDAFPGGIHQRTLCQHHLDRVQQPKQLWLIRAAQFIERATEAVGTDLAVAAAIVEGAGDEDECVL